MTSMPLITAAVILISAVIYGISVVMRLLKNLNGAEILLMLLSILIFPCVTWLYGKLGAWSFLFIGAASFSMLLQLFFPARKYKSAPKHQTYLEKQIKYSKYLVISGLLALITELIWLPAAELAAEMTFGNGLMMLVYPPLLPAMLVKTTMGINEPYLAGATAAIIIAHFYMTVSALRLLPLPQMEKSKRILFGVLAFIPFVNIFISFSLQSALKKRLLQMKYQNNFQNYNQI